MTRPSSTGTHIRETLLYSVYCSTSTDRPDDFIPDDNREYKSKNYWDHRFTTEPNYEWLGSFHHVRQGYERTGIEFAAGNKKTVLVVGCGNSSFSHDLHRLCPLWDITSIDFSKVVVEKMRKRFPELKFVEMDMTNLQPLPACHFDYVLDKAAMDALVADEGSAWEPSESSCKSVDDMVASVGRVLQPRGLFSIVSFQPAHFRRKHLERAIGKCGDSVWEATIKVHAMENSDLGTEFAVFTLTKKEG